jgi:hypothetical protein
MLATVADSMRPTDIIAWLLIKDLVDHRVEIARYRRFKTAVVQPRTGAQSTEANLVDNFYSWIQNHERTENLLRAAEERFSATLAELDRHVRGLGRFIREQWDLIEGELAPSHALDESSERPTAPNSTKVLSNQETPSR